MADELKLKIILDDGSIKEGFLSVEKQSAKSGKAIEDDLTKASKKSGKAVKDNLGGAFRDSFEDLKQSGVNSLGALGRLAGPLLSNPITGAALAVAALGAAFTKTALAGEQANAISAQFENIAKSSGLAVDQFRDSIIASTEGLIDDKDALQIATKGIIALGAEANKIPQILDASRGVSRALGKDFKDTFSDLSQFVETGNARILRNFGLILDLDKAYQAAAKSIGVATAELTEQQKQTVRANLLLEEVPKRFGAAAESVTPLKDAIDRLSVSVKKTFGDVEEGLATVITKAFVNKADLSNIGVTQLQDRAKETTKEIESLQAQLDKLNSSETAVKPIAFIASLQARIISLNNEVQKNLVEQAGRSDSELFRQLDASRNESAQRAGIERTDAQKKKALDDLKKAELEQTAFLLSQDQIRTQAAIQQNLLLINEKTQAKDRLMALEENFNAQDVILEEQKNQQIESIKQKYRDQNLSGTYLEKQSVAAIEETFFQQRLLAEQQRATQLKAIQDQAYFDTLSTWDAMFSAFGSYLGGAISQMQSWATNSVDNFKKVGAQAAQTFATGVGNAFNRFGAALKNGENAGEAFAQAMGDSILQVANNFADLFIQTGIGKLALSYGTDATGYALIAAGAALKILAGVAGAKSNSSSTASAGGGIATEPSLSTELTPTEQLQRQEPGTQVQVTIQGDVLDSDESGSRIVGLINQAFDKKGVVISQGAFA